VDATEKDIKEAGYALLQHLNRLPLGKVNLRRAISGSATHDIDVWFYDKFVGVARVLTGTMGADGLIGVPVAALSALREAFYVSRRWPKRVVLLLVTGEEHILMADMITIGKEFPKYTKSEDGQQVFLPAQKLMWLKKDPA